MSAEPKWESETIAARLPADPGWVAGVIVPSGPNAHEWHVGAVPIAAWGVATRLPAIEPPISKYAVHVRGGTFVPGFFGMAPDNPLTPWLVPLDEHGNEIAWVHRIFRCDTDEAKRQTRDWFDRLLVKVEPKR